MGDGVGMGMSIGGNVQDQVQSNVATTANVISTREQARAERRRLADINRQLLLNADATEAMGQREAQLIHREGGGLLDTMKQSLAGSGRDLGSAGVIGQLSSIEDVVQYNALASIYEARTDASKDRYEAALNDIKSQQIKRNAELQRYAGMLQTRLI